MCETHSKFSKKMFKKTKRNNKNLFLLFLHFREQHRTEIWFRRTLCSVIGLRIFRIFDME